MGAAEGIITGNIDWMYIGKVSKGRGTAMSEEGWKTDSTIRSHVKGRECVALPSLGQRSGESGMSEIFREPTTNRCCEETEGDHIVPYVM